MLCAAVMDTGVMWCALWVLVVLGTTVGTACVPSAFVVVLCRMYFVLGAGVAVHDVPAALPRVLMSERACPFWAICVGIFGAG